MPEIEGKAVHGRTGDVKCFVLAQQFQVFVSILNGIVFPFVSVRVHSWFTLFATESAR